MTQRLTDAFGARRVGDITTADAQRFYNQVADECSHSTARRYLTLLRLIFNKGRAWGDFHGDNPCQLVKAGRSQSPRPISHRRLNA